MDALEARHAIAPARAEVAMRPALLVFVRGPLAPHAAALDTLWARLRELPAGQRLKAYRLGAEDKWRTLGTATAPPLSQRFGLVPERPGCWPLALAEQPGVPSAGATLDWLGLPPVRDMERASHLRFVFDDPVSATELAALGDLVLQHLPVWWGAGGYAFEFTGGHPDIAGQRIAALAKRHWAAQVQHLSSLQWDALAGLPSVNWLVLLGPAFLAQAGLSIEALADAVEPRARSGVYARQGLHGLALAAGPRPLTGDINGQDDLAPYAELDRLLAPLRLATHRPMSGPMSRPEVLEAWLRRFEDPQGWLAADVSA